MYLISDRIREIIAASLSVTLSKLPYPYIALEPYISSKTLKLHHNKHHAGYVKRTLKFIKDTKSEGINLEKIIKMSHGTKKYMDIFNNAAQVWNR